MKSGTIGKARRKDRPLVGMFVLGMTGRWGTFSFLKERRFRAEKIERRDVGPSNLYAVKKKACLQEKIRRKIRVIRQGS